MGASLPKQACTKTGTASKQSSGRARFSRDSPDRSHEPRWQSVLSRYADSCCRIESGCNRWAASGSEELVALLGRAWDPIFRGSGHQSQPDEYEAIADQMVAPLQGGVGAAELADWLIQIETRMHLLPEDEDREIDLAVARTIIDWYEQATPWTERSNEPLAALCLS